MIRTAISTNVGPRENLEDAALACRIIGPGGREVLVCGVYDGAGGPAFGEVASALATAQIHSSLVARFADIGCLSEPAMLDSDTLSVVVRDALAAANQVIIDQAAQHPELSDMATTAVCGLIANQMLIVGWAGDSRCYLYRAGELRRLTRDHSRVVELIELGLISHSEASSHPEAHTITRYLGQRNAFEPGLVDVDLLNGDLVLLCTDGLTDVIPDGDIQTQIASAVAGRIAFDQLPERLVELALHAGTQDNTTVLCCEYETNSKIEKTTRTTIDGYSLAVARVLNHLSSESQDERDHATPSPVAA